MYISKHKIVATIIYVSVVLVEYKTDGSSSAITAVMILGVAWLSIIFCEVESFLNSYGYIGSDSTDPRLTITQEMAAFFGWLLLLIGCLAFLFDWSIY